MVNTVKPILLQQQNNSNLVALPTPPALQSLSNYDNRFSIESGFFIFTLMPSLRCSLNCPHCYLSLEQRRNSPVMQLSDLEIISKKVDAYYQNSRFNGATLSFYWYGGEPTEMGEPYFQAATEMLNNIFLPEKGYQTRHTILTSLLTIDEKWFDFFHKHCHSSLQSSYDGGMRGGNYVKKWEQKVIKAREAGLNLSTITVVNRAVIMDGPEATLDYLSSLGVVETSWLPFMWNEQNDGDPYQTFAPTMSEYSEFMIALSKRYFERKKLGLFVPEIGQMRFILSQGQRPTLANIAGQTLFLLPNGDFVLPDYKNGHQEYMNVFGNGLELDFAKILSSNNRKQYLRKQGLRNHNPECVNCDYGNRCLMEFWKTNLPGSDCFGAKNYIQWLEREIKNQAIDFNKPVLY